MHLEWGTTRVGWLSCFVYHPRNLAKAQKIARFKRKIKVLVWRQENLHKQKIFNAHSLGYERLARKCKKRMRKIVEKNFLCSSFVLSPTRGAFHRESLARSYELSRLPKVAGNTFSCGSFRGQIFFVRVEGSVELGKLIPSGSWSSPPLTDSVSRFLIF